MGQVTIYLEDEIETKMVEAAKSSHLFKSKCLAKLIKEKVDSQWPMSVREAAGTWDDFPKEIAMPSVVLYELEVGIAKSNLNKFFKVIIKNETDLQSIVEKCT